MLDPETFLVEVSVLADEVCKQELPLARRPGPAAALDRSARITLALRSQWARFASERAFWRYADRPLRAWFPTRPSRPQFHRQVRRRQVRRRQVRRHQAAITAVAVWVAGRLAGHDAPYELLDGTAVPTRNAQRRGGGGLPGLADIGSRKRRGGSEGLCLLGAGRKPRPRPGRDALRPAGQPGPPLLSAGRTASGVSVADAGFAGGEGEPRGVGDHHAQLVAPPQGGSGRAWPRPAKRWVARIRQLVEIVCDRRRHTFRLERERPHALDGFQARLAAKMARHNVCLWRNRRHGQPDLADVLGW